MAGGWDPGVPSIAHLVTYSTPHEGAPLAAAATDLRRETITGDVVLEAASRSSSAGVPLPDPNSVAVAQLAPGSAFLGELAREDLVFGTRALSLAIPNDLIVPADRTQIRGELSRVVPPRGLNGHSGILTSGPAAGLAYTFLRDAPLPCPGAWDRWGATIGSAIGALERELGRALGAAETAVGVRGRYLVGRH